MVSVGFAALSCAIDLLLHEEPGAAGGRRLGLLGACLPGGARAARAERAGRADRAEGAEGAKDAATAEGSTASSS